LLSASPQAKQFTKPSQHSSKRTSPENWPGTTIQANLLASPRLNTSDAVARRSTIFQKAKRNSFERAAGS
jgi:hypothetical protein